ncbi:MAG: glycerol kinase GlpK [Natronospirillum sp.]|uniref:FGGY family carbohydrate kinase n=1 Tax=Natronospirillum sp. TaxID=2812955 RepID=UPI0025D15DE3|nr:glycerol kinase GlpK [Natronospirillum sp.]MCH8551496.1 glycerol kinase GlpK [Natronospirillum sp.]
MNEYLIIIEQGTTHTGATLMDRQLQVQSRHQVSCPADYRARDQWEFDPQVVWTAVCTSVQNVIRDSGIPPSAIAGMGLANQRETCLLWEKDTGRPVHPALSWQDRRTASICSRWREQGHEEWVRQRTGLTLDPQFSASKLHWLLHNEPGLLDRAVAGELLFGTMDTWLLWQLTGGKVHATDATNAGRTLLYNLHDQRWDDELLNWFGIPRQVLPEVRDCAAHYGDVSISLFGASFPVCALIGDQHASLVGHGCLGNGEGKATYGSGCFALVNTGNRPIFSQNRLLTTLGYQIAGQPVYALEGSVVTAGSVVDWLEEDLNIVSNRDGLDKLAESVPLEQEEIMVPAFTGLGAPYWEQQARGALFGLTRDTRIRHLVAAALRSVAYQTEDMLKAMRYDDIVIESLCVDGGELTRRWFLQSLADITGVEVVSGDTDAVIARGTAMLCSVQLGWHDSLEDAGQLIRSGPRYQPKIDDALRDSLLRRWDEAVMRIQTPRA